MLSEKSISALAQLAGIEAEVITSALKDEAAQDIELVKTNSFTDDELKILEANIIEENQGDYESAKIVGIEKSTKALCDKVGIERTKDPEEFAEKYKEHILKEAGKEPDKKIQELTQDNDKLRSSLSEYEQKLTTTKQEYESKLDDINTNSKLTSLISGDLGQLSKDDYVTLYRKDHQIISDEGKSVLKVNGEVLKNNLQNPIDPFDHFKDWLKEKGVTEKQTGRGGGNKEGEFNDLSNIKNREELNKHFEEKGITDFNEKQKVLNEVIKNEGYKH